jgi:hypothetical protein
MARLRKVHGEQCVWAITQTKHSKPRRVFGLNDNPHTNTNDIEIQDVCFDKPLQEKHELYFTQFYTWFGELSKIQLMRKQLNAL